MVGQGPGQGLLRQMVVRQRASLATMVMEAIPTTSHPLILSTTKPESVLSKKSAKTKTSNITKTPTDPLSNPLSDPLSDSLSDPLTSGGGGDTKVAGGVR